VNSLRRLVGLALTLAVLGAVAGVVTVGFEYVVINVLLSHVRDLPPSIMALVPLIGLVATALVLRWSVPGSDPSTTDDLMGAVSGHWSIDPTEVPGKAVASAVSVGSGAPMGIDGAAAYLGGNLARIAYRRSNRRRTHDHISSEVLLAAGAAAALAVVFRQPVFAALFVVEVPYRTGLDLRRLPAAAVGAASGYAAFVTCTRDWSNLFDVPTFTLNGQLVLAAVVGGVLGGVIARVFGTLCLQAGELAASVVRPVRIPLAGAALAVLFIVSKASKVDGLSLGPGGAALGWAADSSTGRSAIIVILVVRLLATPVASVGGSAGGLLIPLITLGALAGRVFVAPIDKNQTVAVMVLCGAACLAAAYRVPLAAVAFATASLGSGSAVVAAMVAVLVAMAVSTGVSITSAQADSPVLVPVHTPQRRSGRHAHPDDSDLDDLDDAGDLSDLDDLPEMDGDSDGFSDWR
jgi:CIC family chloride channel protein